MPRRTSHYARAAAVVVVLAAYLVASLGALPSGALLARWGVVPVAEPFPCREHACGCLTAESCWNSCCCFTIAQRVAWAHAHGSPVPTWAGAVVCASHGTRDPVSLCCAHASRVPRGGAPAASALDCRGVNPWVLTGVPPAEPSKVSVFERNTGRGRVPAPAAGMSAQSSPEAPVPPPRA